MLAPMTDLWRQTDLPQIAAALATRPGHENTRTLVATILRSAFHADYAALDHEVRLPEVRGRADMLFRATVSEFKHDLSHIKISVRQSQHARGIKSRSQVNMRFLFKVVFEQIHDATRRWNLVHASHLYARPVLDNHHVRRQCGV